MYGIYYTRNIICDILIADMNFNSLRIISLYKLNKSGEKTQPFNNIADSFSQVFECCFFIVINKRLSPYTFCGRQRQANTEN